MQKIIDDYFVDGCLRCPLGASPACKVNTWQAELLELRRIVNETELSEEIKWGAKFVIPYETQSEGDIHLYFDKIDETYPIDLN